MTKKPKRQGSPTPAGKAPYLKSKSMSKRKQPVSLVPAPQHQLQRPPEPTDVRVYTTDPPVYVFNMGDKELTLTHAQFYNQANFADRVCAVAQFIMNPVPKAPTSRGHGNSRAPRL
jgi:hypothetical protein